MQSKDTKIIRLLKSEDEDTVKLGQLSLIGELNLNNVIYWYLYFETKITFENIVDELKEKFNSLLGWDVTKKHAITKISDMMSHMQNNNTESKSVIKFFEYYNEYLYGIVSSGWSASKVKQMKNELRDVNIIAAQSDKDL